MSGSLHVRLKAARLHAGFTQEQVATRLGVSKSSIAQWEARDASRRTVPTYENLIKFAKMTGAPLDWLASDEPLDEDGLDLSPVPAETRIVPVIEPGFLASYITGTGKVTVSGTLIEPAGTPESAVAVRCQDGAMEPEIRRGDLMIIDPDAEPRPGGFVVVLDGESFVGARKYRDTGRGVELVPLDGDYPTLDASDFTIVPVIALRRSLN